jgi:hypothetical protein
MTIVTRSMSKSTKNTTNKPTLTYSATKSPSELVVNRLSAPCQFKVNIDFNEASLAWRSNKQSIGNGCFEYTSYEKPKRTRRATQRYSPNSSSGFATL